MGTTRSRVPLGTKIVLGLALNLALLAAGMAAVLVLQVRLNPGWLLAGRTGERLQAAAQLLVSDLAFSTPNRLEAVLDRYRDAYQMDFRIFDNSGTPIAGPTDLPPSEVMRLVGRQRGPFGGRGGLRGPQGNIAPRQNADPIRTPRGNPGRIGSENFPRFVLRAGDPPAYWVVIHLPPVGEFRPLTLVLRSESLWSGALLFDLQPWLLAAAGALALSGLFWLPLIRGITHDIRRMMRGTEAIASGRFESRLDLERSDELGRLAEAIDRMAERLSGYVAGQKRFLGDAAHELCSPIARMQAAVALLETRPPADAHRYIEDLREELDEMSTLVAELLAFSRATHGRSAHLENVSLRKIVDRAVDREAAEPERIRVEIPDTIHVIADAGLLQRAIANLIRNAFRHAGDQGPILATAQARDGSIRLTVSDQGPGVPEDSLPRLFEPFFRPEASRTRESGGVGLGLAIVKTCIDACGGTVSARNRKPSGLEVTIDLKSGPSPA